jgi:cytochrome P450
MTVVTTDQADHIALPAARGACPFAPPPAYERARREEPISTVRLWDGSPVWMVTRYDDVRAVLSDARFSADAEKPGFPFLSETRRALATTSASFIRMDEPEHGRLRRMLTGDFMLKRIEALRPQVQEFTDELIDRMTEGGRTRADLVAQFALPLPSLVICLMLGVPYEDHAFFQQCSRTMLNSNSSIEEVYDARIRLRDYLAALAERKRERADEGIVSRLVERDELNPDEVASMSLLLLVAGHETTANMTALSTLALLRNPRQLERLRAQPELMRGAVEELLRYLTIVHSGLTRVATEDVELAGRTIRAGEGVVCMINAANRDESAFPGGDELDVSRNARRHVAFGFGVHQCLGQPLARLELQIALSTLLRRLPGLRLDTEFEQVSFRHEMLVYGVHALPIAW